MLFRALSSEVLESSEASVTSQHLSQWLIILTGKNLFSSIKLEPSLFKFMTLVVLFPPTHLSKEPVFIFWVAFACEGCC